MSHDLKHSPEKPRFSLLPWDQLEGVVRVFEHGADKYAPDNWREASDYRQYLDALGRHVVHAEMGVDVTPDSGLDPLDHIIANCLILKHIKVKNAQG